MYNIWKFNMQPEKKTRAVPQIAPLEMVALKSKAFSSQNVH